MNTLYNIMRREQERNPDVDVYYSEKNNSLQYINGNGVMTVVFGRNGMEDFYYRSHSEKNTGLGFKFQSLVGKGAYGKVDSSFMLGELPYRFLEIAQAYQFSRETMNIDYEQKKHNFQKNRYDMER